MKTFVPLRPKDSGGPLRVIILGRVSTVHQNVSNIEASFEVCERYLADNWDGPTEILRLGEQGSGLSTERETIIRAEEEIATGTWDLVLMEDLSRAHRNPRHQYAFVQNAVDAETRVIAIGDNLDTADPNWETMLGTASLTHGLHVPHTRQRVRRTADHAFKQGGMVLKIKFGYRKLTEAEAASGEFGPIGLRIALDPEATPIIQELRGRLLAGADYKTLAEWLNDRQVPPGPYVTSGRWSGRVVRDLLRDPILHGRREFRRVTMNTVHATGKRRARVNENPETEVRPELAHMTVAEQAEMWKVMDARVKRAQKKGRKNPLYGLPRHRSIWPAKHICCGICGAVMERTWDDQLKCSNAFAPEGERCWNHVQVRAEIIRQKLLPQLLSHLRADSEFYQKMVDAGWAAYSTLSRKVRSRFQGIHHQLAQLEREEGNLAKAVRLGGELPALVKDLEKLEKQREELEKQLSKATKKADAFLAGSRAEFEDNFEEAVLTTARSCHAFTDFMKDHVSQLVVCPVQTRDNTQVYPRVKMTLVLPAEDGSSGEAATELLLVADCFEPSQHVQLLDECRAAMQIHPTWGCRRIGKVIDKPYMTVKRSLRYLKKMEEAGAVDPLYRTAGEAGGGRALEKAEKEVTPARRPSCHVELLLRSKSGKPACD